MKKIKLFIPVVMLFVAMFFGFTENSMDIALNAKDLPSFAVVVKDQYGTTPIQGVTIKVYDNGVQVGNAPTTNSSGVAFCNNGINGYPYPVNYKVEATFPPSYGPSFIYYYISNQNYQTQYINMGAPFE